MGDSGFRIFSGHKEISFCIIQLQKKMVACFSFYYCEKKKKQLDKTTKVNKVRGKDNLYRKAFSLGHVASEG